MRRTAVLILVAALAIAAVAAFAMLDRSDPRSTSDRALPTADSVWYHASDVGRLGRTGRPQLVEFFHPG